MSSSVQEEVQLKSDNGQELYKDLLDAFGPTMDLKDLAGVLRRNRNSIRMAINRIESANDPEFIKKNEWAVFLARHKFKVGKRMMFSTRAVAKLAEGIEV